MAKEKENYPAYKVRRGGSPPSVKPTPKKESDAPKAVTKKASKGATKKKTSK